MRLSRPTLYLSLVFLCSIIFIVYLSPGATVNAGPGTYPKSYNIGNVLTDFQYFVGGDFTGSGHTVGAVAIGGSFDKDNTIADGQVTASYINDVVRATIGTGNYYPGDKTVYYATNSTGASLDPKFVQNPGYIDMISAFSVLAAESVALADAASYTAIEADVNTTVVWGARTLNIDVTNGNIEIPWSLYQTIDCINLVGYTNADYLKIML